MFKEPNPFNHIPEEFIYGYHIPTLPRENQWGRYFNNELNSIDFKDLEAYRTLYEKVKILIEEYGFDKEEIFSGLDTFWKEEMNYYFYYGKISPRDKSISATYEDGGVRFYSPINVPVDWQIPR